MTRMLCDRVCATVASSIIGMVLSGVSAPIETPESEDPVVVLKVDIELGDIIMGELLDTGESIVSHAFDIYVWAVKVDDVLEE